jgi:hypothetical protein
MTHVDEPDDRNTQGPEAAGDDPSPVNALSFEKRVALIVDRERFYRDNQRRTRLLPGRT